MVMRHVYECSEIKTSKFYILVACLFFVTGKFDKKYVYCKQLSSLKYHKDKIS